MPFIESPLKQNFDKAISATPVCILGMHRCGTSMVASLLSKCGLHLGASDELLRANPSNALGYFEHQKIAYSVNDALLKNFGGSWEKPPVLKLGWEKDSALQPIRTTAENILHEFDGLKNWGWKDPRTSLLIPFWQTIVPQLKFVICLRNPLTVAASLQKRDGISLPHAISLWMQYISAALAKTTPQNRIVVFYEDFFSAPEAELERLTSFLNLSLQRNDLILQGSIYDKLRHHDISEHQLQIDDRVDAECKALYLKLRKTRNLNVDFDNAGAVNPAVHGRSKPRPLISTERTETEITSFRIPQYPLIFPQTDSPVVSIIIPTFNRAGLLLACLRSILYYTDVIYEIIIVNDASTDETADLLKQLQNVTVIDNVENLDFLRSVNLGSEKAKGEYLLFLNNDVTVSDGWLSSLLDTIQRFKDCGAVGAKLISLSGQLQEAGASIWRDGSVALCGAGDNPTRPEYNYVRECDYCSAACLLVRKSLFLEFGKFDERYLPAYYEDADLCMMIWQSGHTVVYQPSAAIFHHHMGSRSYEKAAALVKKNKRTFAKKWSKVLLSHGDINNPLLNKQNRGGKRIVFLTETLSTIDPQDLKHSIFYELIELSSQGFAVSIIPVSDFSLKQDLLKILQQAGIEIFFGNKFRPEWLLRDRAGEYDVVVIADNIEHPHFPKLCEDLFPDASFLRQTKLVQLISKQKRP